MHHSFLSVWKVLFLFYGRKKLLISIEQFTAVVQNPCNRPGCRFVSSGMQYDKSKVWFHEACMDNTVTAYNGLSKLSGNMEKGRLKTNKRTKTCNEGKKRDLDIVSINGT